ncbi:nucleic acid-binding, OB-fold protein [Tanacetum coccineum]
MEMEYLGHVLYRNYHIPVQLFFEKRISMFTPVIEENCLIRKRRVTEDEVMSGRITVLGMQKRNISVPVSYEIRMVHRSKGVVRRSTYKLLCRFPQGLLLLCKYATEEHPSETKVFHNEDGNPARANIKQALGSYERPHKGVKASANSDIVYFFTSAQDGDPLQDDVRLCLGDDLKKAQDHNQRQVKDESKDHYPKCEKCRKSVTRSNGRFACESCNKNVDYPVLRYRLELEVSDDTAKVVVVMFNETASSLVKCTADSIVEYEDQGDNHSPLPQALAKYL